MATMALIGPTFPSELLAAGVSLDGMSWDNLSGAIACSDPDQLAAARAVLARHDPTKQLPSSVTGNQWAFALKTCKVASPWRAACARASDADQIRLDLISRSTALQLDDPLLVRVAALATPPIDVPTVMSCAQGMPL